MSDSIHISVSSVGLFERCRRAWALRYVCGIRSPGTVATAFGSALHFVAETWLRHAIHPADQVFDAERARADRFTEALWHKAVNHTKPGLAYLPTPMRSELRVEEDFAYPLPCGVPLVGRFDAYDLANGIELYDHKSFRVSQYTKTPVTLLADTQCLAYAGVLLSKYPSADEVKARWVYYSSTTPGSFPVDVVVSRDRAEVKLAELDGTAREIAAFRAECLAAGKDFDVHSLPMPTTQGACEAYGGCEHRALCGVSRRVESLNYVGNNNDVFAKGKTMSTFDFLSTPSSAPVPAATPTANTVPAPVSEPVSGSSLLSRLRASAPAVAINPPVVEPKPTVAAPTPVETVTVVAPVAVAAEAPATLTATELVAPVSEPVAAPAVKPARKPRAKRAPATCPGSAESAVTACPCDREPLTIFVDCLPAKGYYLDDATYLSVVLEQVVARANASLGGTPWQSADYGKGPAALVTETERAVESGEITGVILVDSQTPEARAVLGTLSRLASTIIRGVR